MLPQAVATLVLAAMCTFACSKTKPKPIAYCVGISLTAEEAITGVAETSTYCSKKPDCQKLRSTIVAGTAGKCVAASKLWCGGNQHCAPTEKRCELNQANLNRLAETEGIVRTSLPCEKANSLPMVSLEYVSPEAEPVPSASPDPANTTN